MKPYRLKHIPPGLYYQPGKGGNNLSPRGKIYQTATNALSQPKSYALRHPEPKYQIFPVTIRVSSMVYEKFKDKFDWLKQDHFYEVTTETNLTDWSIEEI